VPIVLIRHADAGNRQDWTGDDHRRPLSSSGRRQANRLVARLRSWSPQRVLSSPYTRCVETVDPLACSLGLEVEVTKNLAEGVGAEALALLRAVADEKVALCTHGDVIAEILVALADEDRLNLGPEPRQAKGSAWVLEADGGRFFNATYVGPDR
jgi:8-oxo-(d)GTP phosphatase